MIGILGGGLAGLTIAAHCKQPCEVLEANDRVGGHCKSTIENGYTFDEGPHIIFSKNKKTLDYILALLGDNVVEGRRNNKIYYKEQYIKYPFENGIGDLKPQDKYDCLLGYIARIRQYPEPTDFKSWLYRNYGYGLMNEYLLPYNEKIWKCPADELAFDWAEERLPKPEPADVVAAACGIETEGYTHQLNFYYPKYGGIESLIKMMLPAEPIRTNWLIERVSRLPDDAWLAQSLEEQYVYDKIVSTLPLVEMVDIFSGVPQEIKDAAKQLRFNSLITITLGYEAWLSREFTAVYVPDPEKLFHRLSFPAAFSGTNGECIQAEITDVPDGEIWNLSDETLKSMVTKQLRYMRLVPMMLDPKYCKVQRLKYGYPVPTFSYRENLKKVRTYFEDQGVILCGRNAEFEYINMDQCIERGMAVAEGL